jgi:hypothetical protein
MGKIVATFAEPLHHICLTYGLKQTFDAMPHLNRREIKLRGKITYIDNIVAPPPLMSRSGWNTRCRNIVSVSYWRESLAIAYNDEACTKEDVYAFVIALIKAYMNYRHPYTKVRIEDSKVVSEHEERVIATID